MSDASTLPPCGLYRTTRPIANVPAGRLVYFHNHGEPGPGIYLPASWQGNRVQFHERGTPLATHVDAFSLTALPAEGFYRVTEPFFCCESRCKEFPKDGLVQLGYDAAATPILFVPELANEGLRVPDRGTRIAPEHFERLRPLVVASAPGTRDPMLH